MKIILKNDYENDSFVASIKMVLKAKTKKYVKILLRHHIKYFFSSRMKLFI